MKTKWKVVSPYTGIEEDAPANNASSGDVAMPPDAVKKKKKHTLIDRNGKIDGRTKAYREHRKKLENSRQKRNNSRSSSRKTNRHFRMCMDCSTTWSSFSST